MRKHAVSSPDFEANHHPETTGLNKTGAHLAVEKPGALSGFSEGKKTELTAVSLRRNPLSTGPDCR
jgi:hypothetical protein